jgi:hypothetical protein
MPSSTACTKCQQNSLRRRVYAVVHPSSANCITSNDKGACNIKRVSILKYHASFLHFKSTYARACQAQPLSATIPLFITTLTAFLTFTPCLHNGKMLGGRCAPAHKMSGLNSQIATEEIWKTFHYTLKCTFSITTHSLFNSKTEMGN